MNRLLKIFIVIFILFIIGYLLYLSYGDNFRDALGDAVPLPDPIKDPCVFLENHIVTDNVHDKYGQTVKFIFHRPHLCLLFFVR